MMYSFLQGPRENQHLRAKIARMRSRFHPASATPPPPTPPSPTPPPPVPHDALRVALEEAKAENEMVTEHVQQREQQMEAKEREKARLKGEIESLRFRLTTLQQNTRGKRLAIERLDEAFNRISMDVEELEQERAALKVEERAHEEPAHEDDGEEPARDRALPEDLALTLGLDRAAPLPRIQERIVELGAVKLAKLSSSILKSLCIATEGAVSPSRKKADTAARLVRWGSQS